MSAEQLAIDDCARSGIGPKDMKRLLFEPRTAAQTSVPRGNRPCPSMRIHFFDLDGKKTGFYRDRFLGKVLDRDGKLRRYDQPANTAPEVFLAPVFKVTWRQIFASKVPLVICEGEKKAGALCLAKIAAVGLTGVDCFRSREKGISLVSALANAELQDRKVTIAFDSDYATNPRVSGAAHDLEAKSCGAEALRCSSRGSPAVRRGRSRASMICSPRRTARRR